MSMNPVGASAPLSQPDALALQDFLGILMTQLSYQDPLKPMDNREFMAQMAQFTALQQSQQMNDKMSALITNQAALQSVGLIGRTVTYRGAGGASETGTVAELSLAGAAPALTIATAGGTSVPGVSLSQVTAVR